MAAQQQAVAGANGGGCGVAGNGVNRQVYADDAVAACHVLKGIGVSAGGGLDIVSAGAVVAAAGAGSKGAGCTAGYG